MEGPLYKPLPKCGWSGSIFDVITWMGNKYRKHMFREYVCIYFRRGLYLHLIIKFAEDCSQKNERCTNIVIYIYIYTDDYHKETQRHTSSQMFFVSVQNRPTAPAQQRGKKTQHKRNIHTDIINYGQMNLKNNSSIISLILRTVYNVIQSLHLYNLP